VSSDTTEVLALWFRNKESVARQSLDQLAGSLIALAIHGGVKRLTAQPDTSKLASPAAASTSRTCPDTSAKPLAISSGATPT
jgi:hypothetical protein